MKSFNYEFCLGENFWHGDYDRALSINELTSEAEKLLYKSNYRCNRNQKGQVVKSYFATVNAKLTSNPMTNSDYDEELEKICNEIPEEFHPFIRQRSWEEGHSSGYEEVILIASDLVAELKPCIEKFGKSISG